MSGNICGNCNNFKPQPGEKSFNCASAVKSGIKYSTQVRPDTPACEAFSLFKAPAAIKTSTSPKSQPQSIAKPAAPATAQTPKATPKRPSSAAKQTETPRGLCAWGRVILAASIILVIALISWGIYACTSPSSPGGGSKPTPTPSYVAPILQQLYPGQWAETSIQRRAVISATPTFSYRTKLGEYGPPVNAPPGMVFIIVQASTAYLGAATMATSPGDFLLRDSQGHQYGYEVYQGPDPYPATLLSSGQRTAGGVILFTVPAGTSGMEVSCILQGAQPVLAVWYL